MNLTTNQNEIRCEYIVLAKRDRVWNALTTPEGWCKWFSSDVEGEFTLGSNLRLDFGHYGDAWAVVVEREEEKVFAYAWDPTGRNLEEAPRNEMTTVRFEISDDPAGTRIVMVESGFQNIASDRRLKAFEDNSEGWASELGEMVAWLDEERPQKHTIKAIRRERVFQAPIEKLWHLVGTPEGLSTWFCVKATGTVAPGEIVILTFASCAHAEKAVKIVFCEPGRSFVYRWHPGSGVGVNWTDFPEAEATLTTVTLTPEDGGVRLKVVEEGFDAIPESRIDSVINANRSGWTAVLGMIQAELEQN